MTTTEVGSGSGSERSETTGSGVGTHVQTRAGHPLAQSVYQLRAKVYAKLASGLHHVPHLLAAAARAFAAASSGFLAFGRYRSKL
jgi:hypothetical protein